jgi:hypothetical protein
MEEPPPPLPPIQVPPLVPYVRAAVGPLRMIFWGGLLVVLDFKFNGFDLLNDTLGMILVVIGVARLSGIPVSDRYRGLMNFVLVMAVLSLAKSVINQIPMKLPTGISILIQIFSFLSLVATTVFCRCMAECCRQAQFDAAGRSWQVTSILFIVIYLMPLGLLDLTLVACMATNRHFSYSTGPAGVLLVLVFFIPLVHLFVSTSRMKRAALLSPAFAPQQS